MQNDPPDPKLLDRVLYEILQQLLVSSEFLKITDEACLRVAGASTPALRRVVREAFMTKVGI